MPYPIDQITPETPDAEKEAALQATIQQMVQEGMPEEEAKAKVMQMAQDMAKMPSFPSQQPTNYGQHMRNPNSIFMRGKPVSNGPGNRGFHTVMNDRYTNFNPGFLSDGNVSNK